jgi:ATP-dependent exoDNAse (exonuclease V) beta subunit
MKDIQNYIIDYFKGLAFIEDTHKYSINAKSISISVSGLIKKYVKEFDANYVSKQLSIKTNVLQKDILDKWKKIADDSCERGNEAHKFGEKYIFDNSIKPTTKLEEAIVKFWNELPEHIIPVCSELQMYHKTIMFAGTADILLHNTLNDTYIICDYKTNIDIFKNFQNKKMLAPFNNLLDCAYNKYQLQLSYYQILFEQTGYKVSSRKLIWLKDDGNYEMYDMTDYTDVLNKELIMLKI